MSERAQHIECYCEGLYRRRQATMEKSLAGSDASMILYSWYFLGKGCTHYALTATSRVLHPGIWHRPTKQKVRKNTSKTDKSWKNNA